MKLCTLSLAALSLSLLGIGPSPAAEPEAPAAPSPAPSAAPTTLGTVVVKGESSSYEPGAPDSATGLSLTLRETPQSVTVVTRERMEDQNLQSLRDVLDNTSGVYSYAYDTERVVFTSRGFKIDSTLYDGVPATANFSTDSADETLDTGLYERIEIVRGATGLLTGAGSPSASVNLVRKRADSRTLDVDARLTAGSWDDRRALVDVSTPLTAGGGVRARGVAVYQHRESFQDLYENEKKVFYGIVDADLTDGTTLSLGFDSQDTRPQANTWGSFPLFYGDGTRTEWGRSVTTAADWSFWNKTKQSQFAELRHQFTNGWSARATLTHRTLKEDLALFYVYGFPDRSDGTGLTPFEHREKGDVDQDALDLHVTGSFNAFRREHELVVGYNGSRIDIQSDLFEHGELADVGNFFEWDGDYPAPAHAPGVQIADIETRQHALYAAARVQIADPLKAIVGTRLNRYKTDFYYLYSAEQSFRHDHTKAVPYAGLIYDLGPTWSLFTSYTTIFNPQNAQDVDGGYLHPIEGESFEAGIKGEHFGGRFNTALSLFETRQDNVAEPVFDPETGEAVYVVGSDNRVQASRAIDGTRTRGFELEATGSPAPGWNASIGWSRYLLRDGNGDSVKPWIPRTLVRAFGTWKAHGALEPLVVGGGVNWQSASRVDVEGPEGLANIRQGSVALVSLMARWQFTPGVSLQLNGANLLDRKYYVLDEYGNLYFGTPASVSASLNYRF